MQNIKIALDWTPNTNHTGLFVALDLGYFTENLLHVEIINPKEDNYAITPAKKLEMGLVDFAVTSFESVISLNTKENSVQAIAVAALLQEDLSSIVTLKSSNIDRPRALENHIYASYKARYEDKIVKKMITNDNGSELLQIIYPDKLGIWNTLLNHKADATWIFDNWEGIEAKTNNIELNHFKLADFGIPYGYSPVIITTKENIEKNSAKYQLFLECTRKGYQYTINNTQAAVQILSTYLSNEEVRKIDLIESQAFTSNYYGDAQTWGKMDLLKVDEFIHWLIQNDIEDETAKQYTFFTNELLNNQQ